MRSFKKNQLIRPAAANVDHGAFCTDSSGTEFKSFRPLLVMMSMEDIPVTLCFNKQDTGEMRL